MTTYTAINATETQSGKPITESLMTRLANNLLAVVEGDATAPVIHPKIMPQGSGGVGAVSQRSSGGVISSSGSVRTMYSMTFDNEFRGPVDCTISVSTSVNNTGGDGASNFQLLLDGSVIAQNTASLSSGSQVNLSSLESISIGTHTVEFRMTDGGSTGTVTGTLSVQGGWL